MLSPEGSSTITQVLVFGPRHFAAKSSCVANEAIGSGPVGIGTGVASVSTIGFGDSVNPGSSSVTVVPVAAEELASADLCDLDAFEND